MLPSRSGSIPLFRLFGVRVYLHWWWFVFAAFELALRSRAYTSYTWNVAEYLALFAIVLMHEFGHALACRQTGGTADEIILWPLGGVAFVRPPPRPGAELWSIAAGPLVNVVLLPVILGLIRAINGGLLVFNLLPVYPLDGGQILRSVLWYFVGPATSLLVATVIGLAGGAGLVAYGLFSGRLWTAMLAGFLLFNCWQSFRFARAWRAHLAMQPPPPPAPSSAVDDSSAGS